MTPKEKAKELFFKFRQIPPFSPYTGIDDGEAKQCALVAVDEILYLLINVYEFDELDNGKVEYWKEVKQEIEKL